MFKSYFKIALRNLTKRRGYALLNIFGLAIGVTCCLLIFQYVSYERSYDKFSNDVNNIVRIRLDSYQQGKLAWKSATSYPAIGPTLKKEFPEVEDFCRLHDAELLLSNEQKNVKFNERKGYYADPSSINMLGLKMLKGNEQEVLNAPDKMIVSESFAKKYFGSEDPIGKQLVSKDPQFTQSYLVTGVFKDYPNNSHLIIDYMVSYATLGKIGRAQGDTTNSTETSWGWYDFYTYIKLRPGTDLKKIESKLPAFCDAHMNNSEWQKTNNVKVELHVLPLADIHLYSNYNQEAEVNGDGQTVSFLFLIGILIILIAWINYINLATARSIERAREVGVRKVLGALRTDLIRQFLTESFMLNFVALIIAFLAAYLLTPSFNHFVGRETAMNFSLPPKYWAGFLSLFFAGSFLAGIYPAFVLSGYQPVKVLKGIFKNSSSGVILRKALITTQFITSVILVAGTMIVYQQISYMRSQKLGTDISQTLVIEGAASLQDSTYTGVFQPFKQEVLKQNNVKNITASTSVMGNEIYWTRGVRRLEANSKSVTLYLLGVDYDFIQSYGIEMKAGISFSKDFGTHSKSVLLNEEAVKLLGFENAQSAINQKLTINDTPTVVGVIADFHQEGLQKKVQPMLVILRPNSRQYYSVKLGKENIHQTVANIEKIWGRYFPSDPFNYFFLDDSFNRQYKSDELFGSIFTVFAMLAILIACFGLSGLSAYNVLQRRKEIGIRKVMGASIQQLLVLLSKDFLRLVLIAFLIAIPITWLIMNKWLEDFAYRINISWWVFAIAGLIAVVIAFATISFQAIKAAVANPVKSLRTE
ncbi:MAG TPA: ABC transporter permease [Puia sp.]|nr:ABC transporter permease [Puia sp.]